MKTKLKYLYKKHKYSFCKSRKVYLCNIVIILFSCIFTFSTYMVVNNYFQYYKGEQIYSRIKDVYYNRQVIQTDNETYNNSSALPEQPADLSMVAISPQCTQMTTGNEIENQPSESVGRKFGITRSSFNDLSAINKDIIGWITIKETHIDYPVVQGKDNVYYLSHNVIHKKYRSGSIFMHYMNDIREKEQNTILFGHNMHDKSMFHDIVHYKEKDFFDKNDIVDFDTLYGNNQWEVFSVYVTDKSFDFMTTNFSTPQEYKKFLSDISEKSMYKKELELNENDRILTLCTCSYEYENARTVVHAKLLK